ncbi:hypothetical protein E2562_028741 [Oryza meyeriana var. granulata]|uniref:Uncharacterized protein n=1 Tax=Oryza meyeriana var. granulata TaxID=110450 RepID=A0A6G1D909_9ORYZ|nr:hypothetical protein E2562_028741 [Oryza meyeriana var. granulata]
MVARLRQEQREIEDRVAVMWRRVQETDRHPKQETKVDRACREAKRPWLLLDTTADYLVTVATDVGRHAYGFYASCALEVGTFVSDETVNFTGLPPK